MTQTIGEWRQALTDSDARIFDLEKAISAAIYASVKGPSWRMAQITKEIEALRVMRDDAVLRRHEILGHSPY